MSAEPALLCNLRYIRSQNCNDSVVSFRLMAYGPDTGSFGLFCDKANITETSIIKNCLPKLNSDPKNGVVFELNQY